MKANYYIPFVLLFLIACGDNQEDIEAPQIDILQPSADAVFQLGESIDIEVSVEENDKLHDLSLRIYAQESNTLIASFIEHQHLRSFTFDTTYTANIAQNYLLRVTAEDHSGNRNEEERAFVVE